MNTRTLLAGLATAVASFLLGWLVYGILLRDYYDANTADYEGLMKKMPHMGGLIVMNLASGLLIAWVMSGMGVRSAMAGLLPGAIFGFLYTLAVDMTFWSFMNMYMNKMVVIVDLVVGTVFTAVLAAVAGWVLGMGGNKAAA